jgi:hypothetical protein
MRAQRQTPATARRVMMGEGVVFVSDGTLLPRGEYPALTVSAHQQPLLALLVQHEGRAVPVGTVGYRPRGQGPGRGASWHYADE